MGKSVSLLNHSYMRDAFQDPAELCADAAKALEEYNFDTLVGVGVSGHLVLATLAQYFDVHMFAVRKLNTSSHSSLPGEGVIGERWVLVDDFVVAGKTIVFAKARINQALAKANADFKSTYVGCYTYSRSYRYTGFFAPNTTDAENDV